MCKRLPQGPVRILSMTKKPSEPPSWKNIIFIFGLLSIMLTLVSLFSFVREADKIKTYEDTGVVVTATVVDTETHREGRTRRSSGHSVTNPLVDFTAQDGKEYKRVVVDLGKADDNVGGVEVYQEQGTIEIIYQAGNPNNAISVIEFNRLQEAPGYIQVVIFSGLSLTLGVAFWFSATRSKRLNKQA